MTKREIKIAFEDFATLADLSSSDASLCTEAVKALDSSHSPYSKFKVGVAMRLQSGRLIYGSNQENVAYPSGLCAERVALFTWGATCADDPIECMAITAHTDSFALQQPITPCGACLQVLAEYEQKQQQPITVLLYCQNGPVWKAQGIQSFLPFLFFEHRLQ
jgi:cytidine deaminase